MRNAEEIPLSEVVHKMEGKRSNNRRTSSSTQDTTRGPWTRLQSRLCSWSGTAVHGSEERGAVTADTT